MIILAVGDMHQLLWRRGKSWSNARVRDDYGVRILGALLSKSCEDRWKFIENIILFKIRVFEWFLDRS